jgi:AraC-like DNA-binding protein
MSQGIGIHFFDGQRRILIPDTPGSWESHTCASIRAAYRNFRNLRKLANHYHIGTVLMRRVLVMIRVDFLKDWHRLHLNKVSCEDIAKRHGLSPTTLRKLFKDRGFQIFRGRSRKRISQAALAKATLEAKSINEVAGKLRLHWSTVRALLHATGFLTQEPQGCRLVRPPEPSSGWSRQLRL